MNILALSGSPSERSRSAALLQLAQTRLAGLALPMSTIAVRELPAHALLTADVHHPALQHALSLVAHAQVVLVGTPIYKASYSGLLKVFLDLLPADALRGKTVLPLATGGSAGHLLAVDYALKPVLGAMGAWWILDTVYATDDQLRAQEAGGFVADTALLERLDRALQPLWPTSHVHPLAPRCSN